MRLLIICPAWRRPRTLYYAVKSWLDDAPGSTVLVGISPDDPDGGMNKLSALALGAHVEEVANDALSTKSNALLDAARNVPGWTHLVVMGSAIVTVDTLKQYQPNLDFQGFEDLYIYEYERLWHFRGYDKTKRLEPIGTGRCFSRGLLESLNWRLWPNGLRRNCDAAQTKLLRDSHVAMPFAANPGYMVSVKDKYSTTPTSAFHPKSLVEVPVPEELKAYL